MIRFVSLVGSDTGYLFAFFDTVPDKFVSIGVDQAWRSVDDLRESMLASGENRTEFLARLERLVPDWARGPNGCPECAERKARSPKKVLIVDCIDQILSSAPVGKRLNARQIAHALNELAMDGVLRKAPTEDGVRAMISLYRKARSWGRDAAGYFKIMDKSP